MPKNLIKRNDRYSIITPKDVPIPMIKFDPLKPAASKVVVNDSVSVKLNVLL